MRRKDDQYIKGKGILVGEFSAKQVANGTDRAMAEQKMRETGLRYTNTELVEKNGKWVTMRVYVCSVDDFKAKTGMTTR